MIDQPTPDDLARSAEADLAISGLDSDDFWAWGEEEDRAWMRQAAAGWRAWIRRGVAAEAGRDKLQAFKTWVHAYLDAQGVPHHPPGTHGAEGCRIGDRMDWLMERLRAAEAEVVRLRYEIEGHQKAYALAQARMESQCELTDDLKQVVRYLRAGLAELRHWLRSQSLDEAALRTEDLLEGRG